MKFWHVLIVGLLGLNFANTNAGAQVADITAAHLIKNKPSKLYIYHDLASKMKAKFDSGNIDEARSLALNALKLVENEEMDQTNGEIIHDANMVLGRIAVVEGKIESAVDYLQKASKTVGSPALCTFGPNMSLAKDLIEKNQIDPVLEYFEACKKFWTYGEERLSKWEEDVKNHKMPDFNANLIY